MIRRFLITALCGTCMASHSFAALPVIDATAQAQRVTQQLEMVRQTLVQLDQYSNMIRQLETQLHTYQVTVQQYEAMTGQYGLGELRAQQLLNQWERYYPGQYTGNSADLHSRAALRPVVERLHQSLGEDTQRMLTEMQTMGALGDATRQSADTAVATDAIAHGSYEGAVERLQNYETLMGEIDQTEDVKAAADLQNRLQAEHGLALNHIAQLQASANMLAAKLEQERIVTMAADARMNEYEPSTLTAIPTQ